MKTDDLINMLARGPDVAAPQHRGPAGPLAVAGAMAVSTALMASWLGVRPGLLETLAWPAFWIKLGFVLALALAGWLAAARLAVPGARTAVLPWLIGAPLLVMWTLGAATVAGAPPAERALLFWGQTWRYCPLLIGLLSLPIFGAALWAMRRLAPTRLRAAGAAAGFASGAAAALVYCLHCPEMASSFVGVWYVLGIMLPTALGALIGRRCLAW